MTTAATVRSIVAGGDIDWQPPIPGAFGSSFRLGEWLTGPVTPLFEDWALTRIEAAMHAWHFETLGQPAPLPHHVVINGWYFYSLAWLPVTPRALLRWAPRLIHRLLTQPRRVAPVIPPTVHFGIDILEREWRDEVLPEYLRASEDAAAQVDSLEPGDLVALIDDVLERVGRYFAFVTALAGGAYKAEIQLGTFYHKHLAPTIGGSHLDLLVGLDEPAGTVSHAVESLDWSHATVGERPGWTPPSTRPLDAQLQLRRETAEAAARQALGADDRRRRTFERLLGQAQHLGPIREAQVRELTRPWPTLRRALLRLGAGARANGLIEVDEDVFHLRRAELVAAVEGRSRVSLARAVADRRAALAEAAKLKPPLFTGDLPRFFERINRGMLTRLGMEPGTDAELTGVAVSPGSATGPVRVVLDASGFETFRPGEVLVAPTTAPAWNPLFELASAVITDGGNLFSHASIASRDYGIPAVVGCGQATGRLVDGQQVTVDGTRGTVTLAR